MPDLSRKALSFISPRLSALKLPFRLSVTTVAAHEIIAITVA